MIKEKAIKWAEALESGKYSQAKRRLKSGDGYCCLGVLCDIEGLEFEPSGAASYRLCHFGHELALPVALADALEIKYSNGFFRMDDAKVDPEKMPKIAERFEQNRRERSEYTDNLADMNDFGIPFPEIAAFIRLNYEIL